MNFQKHIKSLTISFGFLFCFIFNSSDLLGQWCVNTGSAPYECDTLEMVDFTARERQQDFVFDTFSKWKSGITINGGTVIKVVASNKTGGNSCAWKLRMRVNNEIAAGFGNEWETLNTYGSPLSGNKPSVGLLQVRVNNGCNTPETPGAWLTFTGDLAVLDIIDPTPNVPANGNSSCSGGQTNGAGTWLGPEYNEFVFNIDYRIVPNVNTNLVPGRYELKVEFCISQ